MAAVHRLFVWGAPVLLLSGLVGGGAAGAPRLEVPPLDAETAANRALLERVQRATFGYFWDGAEPTSGMALEGSGSQRGHSATLVTVGGSGFGAAAIVVAASRGWVTRAAAVERLLRMTRFLTRAHEVNDPAGHAGYRGAWSHWLSADPANYARTVPFGPGDDGGDIVETADMIQGLLIAASYFDGPDAREVRLRAEIDRLWALVDWRFYASAGDGLLRWHWSPTRGFWTPADPVGRGWNEALNVYVLGAAAPDPARRLDASVYRATWVDPSFGREHEAGGYVFRLPPAAGGPLFFAHYSFIGLDPRLMQDDFDNYWRHNVTHTLMNRAYALYAAPRSHGYGEGVWGLTASQGPPSAPGHEPGYGAWAPPPGPDGGTIAPTAALSSFPYTPWYSMQVLRWLADGADRRLSAGPYGFYDAYNPSQGWVSDEYLAIDQGPIVCMLENYRTGLLWKLMSRRPDVQAGLRRLGISEPRYDTGFYLAVPEARSGAVELMRHVDTGAYELDVNLSEPGRYTLALEGAEGQTVTRPWDALDLPAGKRVVAFGAGLAKGRYLARLSGRRVERTLPVILH